MGRRRAPEPGPPLVRIEWNLLPIVDHKDVLRRVQPLMKEGTGWQSRSLQDLLCDAYINGLVDGARALEESDGKPE